MRPHPCVRLRPEHRPGKRVKGALEIGQGQSPIHGEPFHLMESGQVGGVDLVGTEGASQRDHVDRQFTCQQRADLYRRGMCTQDLPRVFRRDVEGVLRAARRVVGQKIQGIEVEMLGFDLGAVRHFPSHRDEGVGDVLRQDRDGVAGPQGLPSRGQCHVDAFRDEYRGVAFGTQRLQPVVIGLLRLRASRVDELAGLGPLVLRERTQRLTSLRQRRLFSEMVDLRLREAIQIVGGIKGSASSINGSCQKFR
ncbi:Uncharacterised protein [Mycobacteroides abscessus subsp. abscessus]|nr:Uncharacterised protein [Mycobacteroides abscessus subsp. abscessus]